MGEGLRQRRYHQEEDDDEELFESDSYSSNSDDDDFTQDVTRSPPASSSPSSKPASDGPLREMSSLMEHLPIKRGLSKYYQGKSQSYTSLAAVSSIEDLPKKETPLRKEDEDVQELCRRNGCKPEAAKEGSQGCFLCFVDVKKQQQ